MSDAQNSKSNVPEFSVGDLAFSLKKTLEENFGRVRVRGEIGRVSRPASGHVYTNIKDENATIDAVCWKGNLSKLTVQPEEGLEVIITGSVTTYPQSSKYQIRIESMELAGEGALLKMLEERKKKLAAEGLFDEDQKRPLPFLPETIGVITSPTGAVIRDILHRLSDRFPRHVLLWPVLVQGDGAASQITAAIEGFQSIEEQGFKRPDLLIVARGGGSLEDLMPFNEENVVRAVANSAIPVISAVGHETDTTLCDFAADLRAPTPTGAAEMAVPVRNQLVAQLLDDEQRLVSSMNRMLSENRHKLDAQAGRLGDPNRLLETQNQKLDHLTDKISTVFSRYLGQKNEALINTGARLIHPRDRLNHAQKTFEHWSEQIEGLAPKMTHESKVKLDHAAKMLEAYSFKNVLQRGFSVIRDQEGTLISDASLVSAGQAISIQFRDQDNVQATIGNHDHPTSHQNIPAKKPPKKKNKEKDDAQTSLF